MRHAAVYAQCRGHAVGHSQAGIGQRHAREQRRMGHRLARRPRVGLFHRLDNGGNRHFQPLHGQGLRNGPGFSRNVTFEQLRNGVHAAGRRDVGRNADGQLRIDQCDSRHQPVVAKAFFKWRIVRRNHGVFRGLRPGAGRGGHGQARARAD